MLVIIEGNIRIFASKSFSLFCFVRIHDKWSEDNHSTKLKFSIKDFFSKSRSLRSNGLVVKTLDFQSRGPEYKTTGWLQGRLSLSSFRAQ